MNHAGCSKRRRAFGLAVVVAVGLSWLGAACGPGPEEGDIRGSESQPLKWSGFNDAHFRWTSSVGLSGFMSYAPGLASLLAQYGAEVIWERPDGSEQAYAAWPFEMKQRLKVLYARLIAGKADLGLRCPVPSSANLRVASFLRGTIYFTRDEAFDVFAAHVAHALYLEHKKLVPWSLSRLSPLERRELFASYRYHRTILNDFPPYYRGQAFQAQPGTKHQSVCDPRVGFRFMTGISSAHPQQKVSLLGPTEEQTLVNLTWWAATKMAHHDSSKHGGLQFLINNSRLEDRLEPEVLPNGKKLIIAQFGCHGASKILYDLAKSVNIPLLRTWRCPKPPCASHGGLIFRQGRPGRRILEHTDEIYASAPFPTPLFPIDEATQQKLTASQTQKAFFESYWPLEGDLAWWGFDINYNLLLNGKEAHYYLGAWQSSTLHLQSGGDNQLFQVRKWHVAAELCGWPLMQWSSLFESMGEATFTKWLDSGILVDVRKHSKGSITIGPADEYAAQLKACLNAYGGAAKIQDLYTTFMATEKGY